jgi:hypothetical protein
MGLAQRRTNWADSNNGVINQNIAYAHNFIMILDSMRLPCVCC